jgi:hypothetical protein
MTCSLLSLDDGMTDEERKRAWAAWDVEWESAPAVDVGVTAAETLDAARTAGEDRPTNRRPPPEERADAAAPP